jgi:histidinol-phosphate/aromatic aminotransferase/cobyric acid decarboxylase-like protein
MHVMNFIFQYNIRTRVNFRNATARIQNWLVIVDLAYIEFALATDKKN